MSRENLSSGLDSNWPAQLQRLARVLNLERRGITQSRQ